MSRGCEVVTKRKEKNMKDKIKMRLEIVNDGSYCSFEVLCWTIVAIGEPG